MNKPMNLTEFLLDEEKRHPQATGNFTLLLSQLEYAGKIIASHIRKAGLVDILGKTGEKNSSQEEVIELDRYSNDLLVDTLSASGVVHAVGSEELADVQIVNEHGEYDVFFDPLDGSANTEINVTVGTIFSIYKKSEVPLQAGKHQVAAGYILYGTSVMFVYSSGNGVHGFTLDPSIGTFLLSHHNITIPASSNIYSVNEANLPLFDTPVQQYLSQLKESGTYKSRYIGSMVADVHRTLLKGGIFLYPSDKRNPSGKLRLMFEVNPMSYLITHAGGKAVSNGKDPLDINPPSLHERTPVVLGTKEGVEEFQKAVA